MGARPKTKTIRAVVPQEEGPWRNELSAKHKKAQRRSDLVAGLLITVGVLILVVGGYLSWKKAVGEAVAPVEETAPATPPEPVVTPPPPGPPPPSVLERAKAKHDAGDLSGALAVLEEILQDPESPLAEAALAQKMTWLDASSHNLGRKTAKEYLKRFPDGPARAQAEELLKRR
ncbi:MAG: hypothetical protein U0228_36900 [Myxococcaceae bacterium]